MFKRSAAVLPVLLMLSLLVACSSHEHEPASPGKMSKGWYLNKSLGLGIRKPKGWYALSDRERNMVSRKEAKIHAGEKHHQDSFDTTHSPKLHLFAWFQRAPSSKSKGFNSNILGYAERVHPSSGVQSARDYLAHARRLMKRSAVNYRIVKDYQTIKLGGKDFVMLEVEAKVAGLLVKQRYYTLLRKGYAISIVVSWSIGDQLQTIKQTLGTLRIDKPVAHKH